MKGKVIFRVLMILVILCFTVLVMRSIMRPEKYRMVYEGRCDVIKEKLITIRDLQAVYKNEYKTYMSDADSVALFAEEGMVDIIKNVGEIPEGMNEKDALAQGLLHKETISVPAKVKVLENDVTRTEENFNNLSTVLGPNSPKFSIKTGSIKSKTYEIPVYQIVVPIDDILFNMEEAITPSNANVFVKLWNKLFYNGLASERQYKSQYKDLVLGSLSEANTAGNWE